MSDVADAEVSGTGQVAVLFAGQGAQYVGMGSEVAEAYPEIEAVYREADAVLEEALSEIIAGGPEEALTLTRNAQPAILALDIAHARIADNLGMAPAVALGHSLGEYAAWVLAGSLAFSDALELVRIRGQLMQEAVPVGVGAMTAVISTPTEQVEALCEELRDDLGRVLSVAVYNCPGNTVVSGHTDAVEALEEAIDTRRLGITRRLEVSAPFHSELLESAARRFEEAIDEVELSPNQIPVIPNVTAEVVGPGASSETIRQLLIEQIAAPVRWEASLRAALEQGVDRALLMGPGKMLRSHIKRVDRRFPTVCFDKLDEIQALAAGEDT